MQFLNGLGRLAILPVAFGLAALSSAGDLSITPEELTVGQGQLIDFELSEACAGAQGFLIVGTSLVDTEIPKLGTVNVSLENAIVDIGILPDGPYAIECDVTCGSPLIGLVSYIQAVAVFPDGSVCGISNVATLNINDSEVPDCDGNQVSDLCELEGNDCNDNGVLDRCDIADGTSTDLDGNGQPDECDPDCDGDGVPDGAEADCNGNGEPDDCEDALDCNGNMVPDECDLADGTSNDADGNGIPDECDPDCDGDGLPDAAEADCNGNGEPDDCEDAPDCNGNMVPDECDLADGTSMDVDGNGTPDECDPDCDGDGVPDGAEEDCNGNGEPDDCESGPDCNGNMVPDLCDIAGGTSSDVDNNGIPDECDPDCDGDGTPDGAEADCNGNGEPDDCESAPDCNGNMIPDECDLADGTSNDVDGNGNPDECDPDCDGDGLPDAAEGDMDGDGTPDDCEECPPPAEACDFGCYTLSDNGGGVSAPDYGLRLDGLFGDYPNVYTFSFEQPGTSGELCYDGAGTLTVRGVAYGGLDIGEQWDPVQQGFLTIDFVYTGVTCNADGVLVVNDADGNGFGTVVWEPTGESISLFAKGKEDGELASFDGFSWIGWLQYEDGSPGCCQDFVAAATPASDCPPMADCDGDGTPDVAEEDCDADGIPDDCEPDCDGDGIPNDCDDNDSGSINCASSALTDSFGSGDSDHSVVIFEVGSFDFMSNAELTESTDGTATLTGTLVNQTNADEKFEAAFVLNGLVEAGATPPEGSPKQELSSDAYAENGGPVDTDEWRYYTSVEGTLVGACDLAGAVLTLEGKGEALQIGLGASGKNVNFGASSWFDGHTLQQPESGAHLPLDFDGDINIDLGSCADSDRTCLDAAAAHAFWLEGEKYMFTPLGDFTEYANGTALLQGELTSKNDASRRWCVAVTYSDRVNPGDDSWPPMDSPKLTGSVSGADTSDWYYYTETVGVALGKGSLDGAVALLTRRGEAFQVGFGANVKDFDFGASGWMDFDVLEQPSTGTHLQNYYDSDFNLDFVDCPDECAPTMSSAFLHYDFSQQSGGVVEDMAGNMDLFFNEGSGDIDWVSDQNGFGVEFDQDDDDSAVLKSADAFSATALREAVQAAGAVTIQVMFSQDDDSHSNARLVSWSSGTAVTDRNVSLMSYPDGSNYESEVRLTTTGGTCKPETAAPWDEDEVTVYAMTYDAAEGEVRCYANGVLFDTYEHGGSLSAFTDRSFQVGNESTRNRAFAGVIYDVKVWAESLSDERLATEAQVLLGS